MLNFDLNEFITTINIGNKNTIDSIIKNTNIIPLVTLF